MHSAAYAHLGLECSYEPFDIAPGSLKDALSDFGMKGFRGLNVTIPHKESVATIVDDLAQEAKAVGAVNTILFEDGRTRGENTDVYGFVASVSPHRASVDGATAVLLGAGGTARAILYALLTQFRLAQVVVANRHEARATELIRHFEPYAGSTVLRTTDMREPQLTRAAHAATLIVNATPAGMTPNVSTSPLDGQFVFRPDHLVVDSVYIPVRTAFLASASRDGARTLSGLEMFLHQGARSFELWLGRQMPLEYVRPVIEAELKRRTNKPDQHR